MDANIYSIYAIGPLDTALDSASGYPVLDIFYNTTQNLTASAIMTTVLIVCEMIGGIASLTAASRQLWAFSRNGGVPFSKFFAPVYIFFLASRFSSLTFYRVTLNTIFLLMQSFSLYFYLL
jgi:amino acid transporter